MGLLSGKVKLAMLQGNRIATLLRLGRGEIVRGESFEAGGRRLTPIARVRRAEAGGGRFVFRSVEPVGIVEEAGGTSRLLAVGGGRGRRAAMVALVALPVVVFVVASAMARAARKSRRARKRR